MDAGVKGGPLTKSESQEVIAGKGRGGNLPENRHVELQVAHLSDFDQNLEGLLEI